MGTLGGKARRDCHGTPVRSGTERPKPVCHLRGLRRFHPPGAVGRRSGRLCLRHRRPRRLRRYRRLHPEAPGRGPALRNSGGAVSPGAGGAALQRRGRAGGGTKNGGGEAGQRLLRPLVPWGRGRGLRGQDLGEPFALAARGGEHRQGRQGCLHGKPPHQHRSPAPPSADPVPAAEHRDRRAAEPDQGDRLLRRGADRPGAGGADHLAAGGHRH